MIGKLIALSVFTVLIMSSISLYIAARVDELAEEELEREYNAREDKSLN